MNTIALDTYPLHSLLAEVSCRVKSVTGLGFPEVRLDQYNRPGFHGQIVAHSLYGGRTITLEGTLRGATAALYLANRATLEAAVALQLDASNVPVARTLFLTDLSFNLYQVAVVTKSFQMDLEAPGITWGRWQLQLLATDYVVESQTLSTVTSYLPQSGGVTYPVTYPVQYGGSSGGSVIASNNGNAAAYSIISIFGPCINPVISNDSTGEAIRLNLTLVASDTLTIDMRRRLVVQGGSTNKMGALQAGSKFWAVLPARLWPFRPLQAA